MELAGHYEVARAVDLGTGPGDIPIRVAKACPKWEIVAVDASEPMLCFAKEAAEKVEGCEAIKWIQADAKDTQLPAGSFDVLFSNSILHHLSDVDGFWEEIKRLSRPGAVLLFRDLERVPDEETAQRIVQRYAGQESPLLQAEFYRSLLAAYTLEELRLQLDRAGLSMIEVKRVSDRHVDVFGRLL